MHVVASPMHEVAPVHVVSQPSLEEVNWSALMRVLLVLVLVPMPWSMHLA